MQQIDCIGCATRMSVLFSSRNGLGRRHQLFSDLDGFFWRKIQRQVDAVPFNVNPHHALRGWANLNVCGDVALSVDAHFYSPVDRWVANAQGGGSQVYHYLTKASNCHKLYVNTEIDMRQTVNALRAFNRFYTRQIGLLDRSYLNSGMSLTEVRILYEIHDGKRKARQISQYLSLDEGYLSRVLARFGKRGLIERQPLKTDRRQRDLSLTKVGAVQVAELIARSSGAARARLSTLNTTDRKRLFEAMDTIRDCLTQSNPTPEVQLRDLQIGDLGLIASRHGVLYASECGFDDSFEPLVAEILLEFWRNRQPGKERAWIAVRDAQILGSVFCVRLDDETAKLRLFYLEPEARGLGLGRQLLEACTSFACEAGYRQLVLWTHESHQAACALYRKSGFTMVSETPVHNYGQDLVEQAWQIDL